MEEHRVGADALCGEVCSGTERGAEWRGEVWCGLRSGEALCAMVRCAVVRCGHPVVGQLEAWRGLAGALGTCRVPRRKGKRRAVRRGWLSGCW